MPSPQKHFGTSLLFFLFLLFYFRWFVLICCWLVFLLSEIFVFICIFKLIFVFVSENVLILHSQTNNNYDNDNDHDPPLSGSIFFSLWFRFFFFIFWQSPWITCWQLLLFFFCDFFEYKKTISHTLFAFSDLCKNKKKHDWYSLKQEYYSNRNTMKHLFQFIVITFHFPPLPVGAEHFVASHCLKQEI